MDEVIKALEDMVYKAQVACAKSLPSADHPSIPYEWGRLQGRYAGLVDALRVVVNELESQEDGFEDDSDFEGA